MKIRDIVICLLAVAGFVFSPVLASAGPILEKKDEAGGKHEKTVKTMKKELMDSSFSDHEKELTRSANLSEDELVYLLDNTKARKKAGLVLPSVALATGIAVAGAVVASGASNSLIF